MKKVLPVWWRVFAAIYSLLIVSCVAAAPFFSELGRFKYRVSFEQSLNCITVPYAIDSRENDLVFEQAEKLVFLGFDRWIKSTLSDASDFFATLRGEELDFHLLVCSRDPENSHFDFRTAIDIGQLEIFGMRGLSSSIPLSFSEPEEDSAIVSQSWHGPVGDLSDLGEEVIRKFNEKKYLITFAAAGSLEDLLRRNLSEFIGNSIEVGEAFHVATFEVIFYGAGTWGVFFSFSTGPVLFFAVIDDVVVGDDGEPTFLTLRLHALPTQKFIHPWLLELHSVPEEWITLVRKTEDRIAKASCLTSKKTCGTLLDCEPRNGREKAVLSELLQLVVLRAVVNNQDPDIVKSIWERVSVDSEKEFVEENFIDVAAKALYKGPIGNLWKFSQQINL